MDGLDGYTIISFPALLRRIRTALFDDFHVLIIYVICLFDMCEVLRAVSLMYAL